MPRDIDRLNDGEIVDLNNRVVERLRFIRQARPITQCCNSASASLCGLIRTAADASRA